MAVQKGPKLTLCWGHNRITTTYFTTTSEIDLNSDGIDLLHLVIERKLY